MSAQADIHFPRNHTCVNSVVPRRTLASIVAVAAIGAIAGPITASAQARGYVWDRSVEVKRPDPNYIAMRTHRIRAFVEKRLSGDVRPGPLAGEVALVRRGSNEYRELYVCDRRADGRQVLARIRVPDGRNLSYSAPATGARGQNTPLPGCNRFFLSYPMTNFRIVIGETPGAVMLPVP